MDSSASSRESRQTAAAPVIAVQARISENTPRDLRGVTTLARLVMQKLGAAPQAIEGRQGPFQDTP